MKLSALAVATALFSSAAFAAPLTLQTYNPQDKGIFAVNSTLASGPHEAVLFDAQFSVKDGEKLVDMIRKSGKKLSRIVITSGDPDFYFGLEPLVKAFPDAKSCRHGRGGQAHRSNPGREAGILGPADERWRTEAALYAAGDCGQHLYH
ncbi:Arsenate reductase and related proteins, glutaredoxin family [Raoultella ornithinolytica]|nr:Arsenate reductase and related proteins, glutaredoxin family [Raoultella ornithinolytica]